MSTGNSEFTANLAKQVEKDAEKTVQKKGYKANFPTEIVEKLKGLNQHITELLLLDTTDDGRRLVEKYFLEYQERFRAFNEVCDVEQARTDLSPGEALALSNWHKLETEKF